ncbi:MAG: ribonuclease D [Anaerolineaceae bacterium]
MQKPIIVDNQTAFHRMVELLSDQPSIAIDTESNSLHAYHERVCLIQISSAKRDYLVDPLALEDLSELGEVLANNAIQKVLHAGDYDIACLKRDYKFTFINLFDTMLAASALGIAALGYGSLVEKYLDVTLEKKYQRANWGERPLKPEMLIYAQADSHYLIPLRDALMSELMAADRLEILLEDSEALARLTPAMKNHAENLWRVKGVIGLKPKALGLLQELNHTREELASSADLPLFKIMSDQALVEIAQTQPKYIEELSLLPSLSRGQIRRYGEKLMTAVESWRKNPQAISKPVNGRLTAAQLKRRDALSEWRKVQGVAEGVPSNVILTKELLDALTIHKVADTRELYEVMKHSPTRYQRYGTQIMEILGKVDL